MTLQTLSNGSKSSKKHILKTKPSSKISPKKSTNSPKILTPSSPSAASEPCPTSKTVPFDSIAGSIQSKLNADKRGPGRPRKEGATLAGGNTASPAGVTGSTPGNTSAGIAIQPAEPLIDGGTVKFVAQMRFEATGLKHWDYSDEKCKALAFHTNRIAAVLLPMIANSPYAAVWASAGAIVMLVGPDVMADVSAHKKAVQANVQTAAVTTTQ